MIKITPEGEFGTAKEPFAYATSKSFLGRIILPITRWLRAVNALKYITAGERLLDIGCGDGYFIRRCTKCRERFGLDRILGDDVEKGIDFPENYFDYVTMLAVIEHLSEPKKVLDEIWRVLKPDGRLIITTPKKKSEIFIRVYSPDVKKQHKSYFDLRKMKELCEGKFRIIQYRTFALGFNQLFVLAPNKGDSNQRRK